MCYALNHWEWISCIEWQSLHFVLMGVDEVTCMRAEKEYRTSSESETKATKSLVMVGM